MKGFNMSDLHFHPIKKVEVKRKHYRLVLVLSAGGIWIAHEFSPGHEMHVAFLTNLLFALDPTV